MKKFLKASIIILLLFIGLNTYAKVPETCDRSTKDNLGVNKKWEITSNNRNNVLNAKCVDASEDIYDFSQVLTDTEYESLQAKVKEFSTKYKTDLVIVIDNFAYYSDYKNEEYAADFYDYNDFGIDYDKYSGILFLRNTYSSDPYYDIYMFGDAQLYIDNYRANNILDYVYDDLHNGRYYEGFNKLISYLNNYYEQGIAKTNYTVDENGYLKKKFTYPFGAVFGFSAIVTLVIILIMVSKNKMVKKATKAAEYMDKATSTISIREDRFISTHTSVVHHSSSSGSFGGGGSHGGSSGGGHSSGGGRHG